MESLLELTLIYLAIGDLSRHRRRPVRAGPGAGPTGRFPLAQPSHCVPRQPAGGAHLAGRALARLPKRGPSRL